MTIYRRVLLLLGGTMLLIVLTNLAFDFFFSTRSFEAFERRSIHRNVHRVVRSLENELNHLNTFASDWSNWDDAYQFAQNHNKRFIESNLQTSTFIASKLNLIAIFDGERKLIHYTAYDFRNNREFTIPEVSAEALLAGNLLKPNPTNRDTTIGFIETSQGFMLLCVRPILKSDYTGPASGILVQGKLLDETLKSSLEKSLELKVRLYTSTEVGNSAELRGFFKTLQSDSITSTFEFEADTVAGYGTLKDFTGKPSILLQVKMPRELKPLYEADMWGSLANLSVMVALLIFFFWMLSQTVLRRIRLLSDQVTVIGERGDTGTFTELDGNDELNALSDTINRTLKSLNRSRETLREADRRFREILSNIRLIGYVLDTNGDVVFCNKFLLEVTGYNESEVLGKNWFSIFVPHESRKSREFMFAEQFKQDASATSFVRDIVTKKGDRRMIVFNVTVMHDRERKPTGIAVIGEDITDRLFAESEIRRLAMLVESSTESIEITDPDGTFIYVNPAFTKILGYSAADVIGQKIRILDGKATNQALYAEMREKLRNGMVWHSHIKNSRKDGKTVELDLTVIPLRDSEGNITHYGRFARDITKQAELQHQLDRAQRFMTIGELTGGIAHNFNNVLTVIMGNLGLAKFATREQSLESISEAENACIRASDLVKQLMLFSRKTQIELRPVMLEPLLREVFTLVRSTFDRRIEIVLEPQVVSATINGDASQLHQVLLNMCFNAKDALQLVAEDANRPLRISIGAYIVDFEDQLIEAEVRNGKYICITITDTGTGMSEETAKHIFEPFFTTKGVGKGTGLGLSTAFGIVQQHHGWIGVSSVLNVSTQFQIYLPILEQDIGRSETNTVPKELPTGSEELLLIEDEPMVRRVGQTLLERLGYRISVAENGRVALDILAENPNRFALALLDLSMPVMSGVEFLAQLDSFAPQLKVILTSGVPITNLPPELSKYVKKNVAKPYQQDELAFTIRAVIDTPGDV